MKTFREFMTEAYDAEVMGRSQIKTIGSGGRIGAERKKTAPEVRRMKSIKDPETGKVKRVPVDYKSRTDIGKQRPVATRQSQPEKERGSKEVTQSYAEKVKAERRKAAQARIAAKKSGQKPEAAKPKAKEAEKEASKLLSKKAPAKKPSGEKEDHMIKGSLLPKGEKRPYTRDEKKRIVRTGKRLQADLQKKREKPASEYQSSLTPGK
jgi:type IV secretory pathway VirB10-like protein